MANEENEKSVKISVDATVPEAAALMRALEYMERKASKSAYWSAELAPLLGDTGLLRTIRGQVSP